MATKTKKSPTLAAQLRALGACAEAVQWARGRTLSRRTWDACPRGDWLLWLAAKVEAPGVQEAAFACAGLAAASPPTSSAAT